MTADGFKLFVCFCEHFSALVRKNLSVTLLGDPIAAILCMKKSTESRTTKTVYRKFETSIPRNETARPQSQFIHSWFCERFIYSNTRIRLSILLQENMWEYINRSKIHECRNLDWGRSVSFLGEHNRIFFAVRNAAHLCWFSYYKVVSSVLTLIRMTKDEKVLAIFKGLLL